MSFAPESEAAARETLAKPEAMLRVPVGLASPLWGLFAGAAMSGAAWWWMTRWTRPQNLEAMFGAAEAVIEPEVQALAAPAEAAIEAVIEAAPEPLAEAFVEATPEPILEALTEAAPDVEPVGGEAAPVSPVLEALAPEIAGPPPAPKPRKKPAAAPASDIPTDFAD